MAETKLDAKQEIYQMIADGVKAKTGKNIGRSGGQEIFNLVVEEVFARAVAAKTFRFNGGYGSLRVKNYSAGSRQLPSGAKTTFGERSKLRYEQGVTTTMLIEGKQVTKTVISAPAPAPTPAPAAKAAKPAKAKKEAPAAQAPVTANASAAVNLE